MDPKEIQEIKDKAAREAGFDDWIDFLQQSNLWEADIRILNRAIVLASKSGIKSSEKRWCDCKLKYRTTAPFICDGNCKY